MVVAIAAEDVRVRPLEHRLTDATRLPMLVVWIAVTGIVLVLCAAWHNATGVWRGLEVGGVPFWRTPWRLEIVFALVLGYVFACGSWIVRSVRRDLDALAPVLAIEPSELAAERTGIGLFSPSVLFAASAAGVAVGVAINAVVNAILPPGSAALEDRLWRFVRDVAVWTLAIRLIVVVIGSSLRVSRLSEAARIDLLDLRGLAPLARIGLRGALAFAVAASMVVAMAGDEQTVSVTLVTVAIVAAVGALALLLPVRGAHRAIRAAKDAELRAVRAAIARARNAAIVGGAEAAEDATRLGGLLAFEGRIAHVNEWPFDVGTLVRFVVFLALPLGSWIGAALVEWVVARAIG
ncbi:MAG: hypothetical protein DCC71_00800 [Proteobacteria bacterium]|nr:MAG: hypothetical protein DCC71_00800 [Pseudomonadota bacterium]